MQNNIMLTNQEFLNPMIELIFFHSRTPQDYMYFMVIQNILSTITDTHKDFDLSSSGLTHYRLYILK